jgi:hypothetical protein
VDASDLGSALAVGATAGVLSTLHCAAMCGPLAALAGSSRRHGTAAWLGGRGLGYSAAGALSGAAGSAIADLASARIAGVVFSMLAAAALLSAGWRLLRPDPSDGGLVRLRRKRGAWLEKLLALVRSRPALVGALTPLLPCGALYAALAAAGLGGTALSGAATMLAFAVTSSAGLGLAGLVAGGGRALDRGTERALGIVLVAGALVLTLRPAVSGLLPSGASCHDHSAVPSPRAVRP